MEVIPPSDRPHHGNTVAIDSFIKVMPFFLIPAEKLVEQKADIPRLIHHIFHQRATGGIEIRKGIIHCRDDIAVAGKVFGEVTAAGARRHKTVAINNQRRAAVNRIGAPDARFQFPL